MVQKKRKNFVRETPDERKSALVSATLKIISEAGLGAATVRAITKAADVTPGLVRHYFSSKEQLISEAYQQHMDVMSRRGLDAIENPELPSTSKLAIYIKENLQAPIVDQQNVVLWASFISNIHNVDEIKSTHKNTYLTFLDSLKLLISNALEEHKIESSETDLTHMAITANAVIDGLWIEASLLTDVFELSQLHNMALASIGRIIGVPLEQHA